jgi:hypothetical protein
MSSASARVAGLKVDAAPDSPLNVATESTPASTVVTGSDIA